MSQFDFYTFSVQVFWTLSGFFIFYFFVLRFYLANFASLFKIRDKSILLGNKKQSILILKDFYF